MSRPGGAVVEGDGDAHRWQARVELDGLKLAARVRRGRQRADDLGVRLRDGDGDIVAEAAARLPRRPKLRESGAAHGDERARRRVRRRRVHLSDRRHRVQRVLQLGRRRLVVAPLAALMDGVDARERLGADGRRRAPRGGPVDAVERDLDAGGAGAQVEGGQRADGVRVVVRDERPRRVSAELAPRPRARALVVERGEARALDRDDRRRAVGLERPARRRERGERRQRVEVEAKRLTLVEGRGEVFAVERHHHLGGAEGVARLAAARRQRLLGAVDAHHRSLHRRDEGVAGAARRPRRRERIARVRRRARDRRLVARHRAHRLRAEAAERRAEVAKGGETGADDDDGGAALRRPAARRHVAQCDSVVVELERGHRRRVVLAVERGFHRHVPREAVGRLWCHAAEACSSRLRTGTCTTQAAATAPEAVGAAADVRRRADAALDHVAAVGRRERELAHGAVELVFVRRQRADGVEAGAAQRDEGAAGGGATGGAERVKGDLVRQHFARRLVVLVVDRQRDRRRPERVEVGDWRGDADDPGTPLPNRRHLILAKAAASRRQVAKGAEAAAEHGDTRAACREHGVGHRRAQPRQRVVRERRVRARGAAVDAEGAVAAVDRDLDGERVHALRAPAAVGTVGARGAEGRRVALAVARVRARVVEPAVVAAIVAVDIVIFVAVAEGGGSVGDGVGKRR